MAEIENSLLIKIGRFWNEINTMYKTRNLYLFGSYATGTYSKWSDIDIAVILDESDSHSREIFSLGKDFDLRFDAMGFTFEDFEKTLIPVIPEIKRNGIRLY
ncbi:MAG: nucleotidyltransferase domain-containing protein [Spirochaetales bacterium]|nr:nucleotidyltransferase domain-containing protein [Spirochaetales bacterium]